MGETRRKTSIDMVHNSAAHAREKASSLVARLGAPRLVMAAATMACLIVFAASGQSEQSQEDMNTVFAGEECADCTEKCEPSGSYAVVNKAREFLGKEYYSDSAWRSSTYRDPNLDKTDCSGLVMWAYYQALGADIPEEGGGAGTLEFLRRMDNGTTWKEIIRDQLLPGDVILMFLTIPGGMTQEQMLAGNSYPAGYSGHTIIYSGKSEDGTEMCIHENGKLCSEDPLESILAWAGDPEWIHYVRYVGPAAETNRECDDNLDAS